MGMVLVYVRVCRMVWVRAQVGEWVKVRVRLPDILSSVNIVRFSYYGILSPGILSGDSVTVIIE